MQSIVDYNQVSESSSQEERHIKQLTSPGIDSSAGASPQQSKNTGAAVSEKKVTESQTKQPGGLCDKARESWKAIVRALSLSLVIPAFRRLRHPTGRGFHEPLKVAIRQNRLIALLRTLIHIIPFGFALFEIILNWNVYYVGTEPYNPAIYQLLAKAHEVLVQASIATIIFSAVRRDLALGKGLPFGLLFSGLQVSQISYLWSVELWGAMKADFLRPLRKLALFTLIAGGILLAVTSGPASAILLIPRLQSWPAGHTSISINATSEQVWPNQINGLSVSQACSRLATGVSNACPASEWYAIRDWLSATRHTPSVLYAERYHNAESPFSCLLHGRNSPRQLQHGIVQRGLQSHPRTALATTQQAVITDALVTTAGLWFDSLTNVTAKAGHGSPLSDQSDATHTLATNYSQPYSAAVCLPDQVSNLTGSRPVAFPILYGINPLETATGNVTYQGPSGIELTGVIEHPDLFYHQLWDIPGQVQDYRLRWIELPNGSFNGSSIGAVILLPASKTTSEQNLLVCNIAAGWGSSSLEVGTTLGGIRDLWSYIQSPKDNLTETPRPISHSHVPSAEGGDVRDYDIVFSYPDFPQQPINISESWAQYLDPLIDDLNSSLVNVLMQQQIHPNQPYISASAILAMLTANGLARTTWDSILQGDIKTVGQGAIDGNFWVSGKGNMFEVDPSKSQDWVTFRVDSTLEGYGYNTYSVPPRIAIAILTAYCLLVVGHTVYSGVTGVSANCWDTIAEVTALAVNSTPTAALRNTCAGITELHIFKLPVRVLVSKDEEGEGEHLELVFGQVDDEKSEERRIRENRTYGTLPKLVEELEGKKDI
ncbi:MAG: hypothetical protein Q9181_003904 [Wetmoreana brouardii]